MDGEKTKLEELQSYLDKVRGHLRQRQERLKVLEGELAKLQLEVSVLQRAKAGKISRAADLRSSEELRSSLARRVEQKRTECDQARVEMELARDRLSQAERELELLRVE